MTSNTDNPEVLDSVPLPSAAEHRREIMRLTSFLRAIRLGLEAARDLNRELRQTYPELVQSAPDFCSAGPAIKR
jgi:hypothetical protein